jgi:molybdenum cofactor cytidylyltransferase
MPSSPTIAGIVLAAGESRRMGRDKALLPLGRSTFVEHLARVIDGEVSPLIVVLGHHAEEIEQQIHLPPSTLVLHNPDYLLGQLSSLKVALRQIQNQPVLGAVVCLVDHPAISKALVRAMVAEFRRKPSEIVIPTWHGRRGHPIIFPSMLFDELLAAPLEEGARWVVRRHAERVVHLKTSEEGITWDIDNPEDYEALQNRWASLSGEAGRE